VSRDEIILHLRRRTALTPHPIVDIIFKEIIFYQRIRRIGTGKTSQVILNLVIDDPGAGTAVAKYP
jgi:hypothetical protein